jgi:hypothetical protein
MDSSLNQSVIQHRKHKLLGGHAVSADAANTHLTHVPHLFPDHNNNDMLPGVRQRTLFANAFHPFPSPFRFYSNKGAKAPSFSKTVLLPQTSFNSFLNLEKEKELLQVTL